MVAVFLIRGVRRRIRTLRVKRLLLLLVVVVVVMMVVGKVSVVFASEAAAAVRRGVRREGGRVQAATAALTDCSSFPSSSLFSS